MQTKVHCFVIRSKGDSFLDLICNLSAEEMDLIEMGHLYVAHVLSSVVGSSLVHVKKAAWSE